MKKTIKIKKDKSINQYAAIYKTLDIVAQGKTKKKALTELYELIICYIDYMVENKNEKHLVPKHLKKKKDRRRRKNG